MTRKQSNPPESIRGRALVDIPNLGLLSGQYATVLASDYVAHCDDENFDTAAVEPVEP